MIHLRGMSRHVEPYFASKEHHHDTWEISLYTAGQGEGVIDGRISVPLVPGAIICYPPVLPHYDHAEKVGLMGYFLHLDRVPPLGSAEVPVLADTDGRFERVIGLLYDEHAQPRASGEVVQALLEAVLGYLRCWSAPGRQRHPLVERLERRLYERFADPGFSVGDALASMPMSKDHLRKLFIAHTGVTPVRYLAQLRVREARDLLRNGHSVKDVSERVGFSDPYYFSRAYLQITGRRPSAEAS